MPRTFPRFAHDHSDKRPLFDHFRFHHFELPSPWEDWCSPRRRVDSSRTSGTFSAISCVLFHQSSTVAMGSTRTTWRKKFGEHPGMTKNTESGGPYFLRYPRVVHTTWESFWATCASFAFIYRLRRRRGSSPSPSSARARARASAPACPPCLFFLWGPPAERLFESLSRKKKKRTCTRGTYNTVPIQSLSRSIRARGSPVYGACPWLAAERLT